MPFGKVIFNKLDIKTALSTITFENGLVFYNYRHAKDEIGYFAFENLKESRAGIIEEGCIPEMMIPKYNAADIAKLK